MKLNSKIATTAAFLLGALLIAGCTGNAAPEESAPPETASPAPFSDTQISSGIQTGEAAEAGAAILGVWELDKAEMQSLDSETPAPVEVESTRTYTFREDGTGTVQFPEWSAEFEYAVQGNYLTIALDNAGTLEMYQFSFDEEGALLLTRLNNDGSLQELHETFLHPAE